MTVHFRKCISDEDYVQYTLYLIRNRAQFNNQYGLLDILVHTMDQLEYSHIILIEDSDCDGKLIGWGNYRYVNDDHQVDPDGEIAFVDSTIIAPEYRGSRVFLKGFRFLVKQISEENSRVKLFRFYARTENVYLNRLYSKFANMIGQHESDYGTENIYSVEFDQLLRYLNLKY